VGVTLCPKSEVYVRDIGYEINSIGSVILTQTIDGLYQINLCKRKQSYEIKVVNPVTYIGRYVPF